ncbi:hypothetical protein [Campylobacter troglodytis]|uniref:hypothetical protein n=1 Tax=Campylobacter troglodytis TaxID=654363 RepID=UPI00163C5080|nr:hypothetical protein [Campylobacter troglodytis]
MYEAKYCEAIFGLRTSERVRIEQCSSSARSLRSVSPQKRPQDKPKKERSRNDCKI